MSDFRLLSSRFQKATKPDEIDRFVASLPFDKRLYPYDIAGSIAHVKMLAKCKIIPSADAKKIIKALKEIKNELDTGVFQFDIANEDIHLNIEKRLTEKIGPEIAGKLHTARSRNDQVVLDMRLFLRDAINEIKNKIRAFQEVLVNLAERNIDVIMPFYTHLQHAQPVLFSHHLLAYFQMLDRDYNRLTELYRRVNQLPLGVGAGTGVSYPIDRQYLAKLLQFDSVTENSIDTVSDRDFILEFLSDASILAMHLSIISEELILWSTTEFHFVEIPEEFCTTSSIMPQKKNPDVLELIRAKTGRVYGNLISLLTVMKSLPLAYNRDLQEDKEPLFDTVDTIISCLSMLINLFPKLKIFRENMITAASVGFTIATDIADYLVKKGVPFRTAHQIVGNLVKHCEKQKKGLLSLDLDELRKFAPQFDKDVYRLIDLQYCIDQKDSFGGTSTKQVKLAIKRAKKKLKNREK